MSLIKGWRILTRRYLEEPPLVSVVVLNYNGKKIVERCLKSVLDTLYPNFEIIVVDNASSDGSIENVQRNFGHESCLRVIRNNKNLGFAKGNNVGARIARGKYVVFLNQDTEVEPRWLAGLVEKMESKPDVAACQSKLLLMSRPQYFDSAGLFIDRYGVCMHRGGVLEREEDEGQYDHTQHIFSAGGAAMIIRRSVIKEVGLFDPLFFLTYEEIDLCWRIWLRGYEVIFVPSSIVYHAGEGFSYRSSPAKCFHSGKNRLMMLLKNYSQRNLVRFLPGAVVILFCSLVADLFVGQNVSLALARFKAILWVLTNFRRIWKERLRVQRCVRKKPDSNVTQLMLKTNIALQKRTQYFRSLKL